MATWWKVTFTGEPNQDDLEHVAELIREGFTSGQLVPGATDDEADPDEDDSETLAKEDLRNARYL